MPVGSNNMVAQQVQVEQPAISLLLEIVEHNQRIQRANPGCAGPNVTLVCDNCKRLFKAEPKLSGQQRTSYDYERLRRVLLITDHSVMPVFCDGCFEQAVVPAESRWGYPNLVLEKLSVQSAGD